MELDFRLISGWWTLFLSSTARDAYMVKLISLPAFLQTVDRLIGSALPFFCYGPCAFSGSNDDVYVPCEGRINPRPAAPIRLATM